MKYRLKVYSIWEFGQRKDSQGHPHQEDNMFPEYGNQSDNDRLFILCDGMGGHDAGEVASATVCEAMSRSILNDGHDKEGLFTDEDFSNALNAAFDALDKKDSGAEKKMGTTMTFLKLYEKGAFIAHMGDSRVCQIRPGKTGEETRIIFQTEDHSLVNDLIKIGELTKEEARFSKQRNVITRAMQPNMGRRPKADVYKTSDIKAGDYFYMCSDGMLEQSEMESGESLMNIFSEQGGSDENKVEILKSVTEKNRDNHTAFIIHILEVEDPIEEIVADSEVSGRLEDDKFTAIVEEDVGKKDSLSQSDSTEQIMYQTTPDISSELNGPVANNEEETHCSSKSLTQKEEKEAVRWTWTLIKNVIRFLVAAIVVLTVFIGFKYIRSCSEDNNRKEMTERHSGKQSSSKKTPDKRERKESVKKSEADSSNTSAQSATETATPATVNPLESGKAPSPTTPQGTSTIPFPTINVEGDDVVNSDQQLIQDIK